MLDEGRDVDAHRTALHARWVGAVETTLSLGHGHLFGQTLLNLLGEGRYAIFRSQFRHLDALDSAAILWTHLLAKFLSPRLISQCLYFFFSHFALILLIFSWPMDLSKAIGTSHLGKGLNYLLRAANASVSSAL